MREIPISRIRPERRRKLVQYRLRQCLEEEFRWILSTR
jgi:hypothetical protein